MKNSTLYRSNITREKMDLLEELQNEAQEQENNLNVYKRPSREKELDVLWKNFKVNQRVDKSPGIYLTIGFVTGALCMFLLTVVLSFGTNAPERVTAQEVTIKKEKPSKLSFIPMNHKKEAAAVQTEPVQETTYQTHTVSSGDTLERIVIKYYGKNDVSKIEKIAETNKMSNPNALSIGQKLVIPMD